MKKNLKFITFIMLLGFLKTVSATENGVWVAIRVLDNLESASEYHGLMPKKVFWDYIENKQTTGIFRLQHAGAVNASGQLIPLQSLNIKQKSLGYASDVFLKLENVYRLIPLNPTYVNGILGQN